MKSTSIICGDYLVRETEQSFLVSNFIEETETVRIEKKLIEKLDLKQEPLDIAILLFQIEMERYNARTEKVKMKSFIRTEEFSFSIKRILNDMSFENLYISIQGMSFLDMKKLFFGDSYRYIN